MKCRIVSDEHDNLSAELSLDGEIFGEIVISDDDNRMNIVLYPDSELDLRFDFDRFVKVVGKGAERLWEMENDQERIQRNDKDEDADDSGDEEAVDADLEDEDMQDEAEEKEAESK